MELRRLTIHGFRGLDVDIAWASAVVLIGPNDVGKSNILEVIEYGFGGRKNPRRMDPTVSHDDALGSLLLRRLFTLADSGGDAAMLARALQADGGVVETTNGMSVVLASDDEPQQTLDTLVARLHDRLVALVQPYCRDWESARGRVLGFIHLLLQSRWFLDDERFGFRWVCAAPSVEIRKTARALLDPSLWHKSLDDVPLGSAVRALAEAQEEPTDLLRISEPLDTHDNVVPQPEIVPLLTDADLDDPLLTRVEAFVKWWQAPYIGKREGDLLFFDALPPSQNQDVWLDRGPEGSFRVAPHVVTACEHLGAQATERAPSFIRQRGEIVVEPVDPEYWRSNGGHKVHITLRRHGDAATDVRGAGHGMAVWVAVALHEAMRGETARKEERSPILYLIDEPERHLHPLAQQEAARWITERVRAGAQVVLATHSPAFVDLPLEDVSICVVSRSSGDTIVHSVHDDLLGAVSDRAQAFGWTTGELIQLTRAVLLVEGEHDRLVLEHFFGDELRRNHVLVIPLHGSDNLPALGEWEFLLHSGRRLFAMLDNVVGDARTGGKPSYCSKEQRVLTTALSNVEKRGKELIGVTLPERDIIAAFSEEDMRRTVERLGGTFHGYAEVEAAYAREPIGKNYKEFLCEHSGLNGKAKPKTLLKALLDDGQPPQSVGHAVKQVLSRLGQHSSLHLTRLSE